MAYRRSRALSLARQSRASRTWPTWSRRCRAVPIATATASTTISSATCRSPFLRWNTCARPRSFWCARRRPPTIGTAHSAGITCSFIRSRSQRVLSPFLSKNPRGVTVMTRDEFWFWFGVWTSILMLVVAGAINFTGAIPDAWVPVVTKWCAIFAAANNAILTAAKFRGYLSAKAAAIVPDASTVAKILIAAFVLSMFLANGSAQAQGLKKPQITGDFAADAKAYLGIGGCTRSGLYRQPPKNTTARSGKQTNA